MACAARPPSVDLRCVSFIRLFGRFRILRHRPLSLDSVHPYYDQQPPHARNRSQVDKPRLCWRMWECGEVEDQKSGAG